MMHDKSRRAPTGKSQRNTQGTHCISLQHVWGIHCKHTSNERGKDRENSKMHRKFRTSNGNAWAAREKWKGTLLEHMHEGTHGVKYKDNALDSQGK